MVANEFEFTSCVAQCVLSLRQDATLAEQILYLDGPFSTMKGRASMSGWDREVEEAIAAGGLGPISGLFEQGPLTHGIRSCPAFCMALPLKPHVKALWFRGMVALLSSENLNIQSENEAYYLLGAWLHQSHIREEGKASIFQLCAGWIRFRHISHDYLASVVAHCPLASKFHLYADILQSALLYRELSPRARENMPDEVTAGRLPDRKKGHGKWELNIIFSLQELVDVKVGKRIFKSGGLVGGYPLILGVMREGRGDTVKMCLSLSLPPMVGETLFRGRLERSVGFDTTLQLGSKSVEKTTYLCTSIGEDHHFPDVRWCELIRAGGPYVSNDELHIRMTFQKI
jgi:hypothetical protein